MTHKKHSIVSLIAILILLLSGCAPGQSLTSTNTPTSTKTETPTRTQTNTQTPTATMTPTVTPTPEPVSIQKAIDMGALSEIMSLGKGEIQNSIFSPDGSSFVVTVSRGIYVYNTNNWDCITFIPLKSGERIQSLVFSVDGTQFAAGNQIGMVTFWDTESWEIEQLVDVYDGPVTSLDISPDNRNFVTIGDEKELSIWNQNDGTLIKSQIRTKDAGPVYYSNDGKWIMVSEETLNRDLTIWDSTKLQITNRISQMGRVPPEQSVSPYRNMVAAYGYQDIYIYDFDTKEKTRIDLKDTFKFYESTSHIIFLDESSLIFKGEYSDTYHLVDLQTYERREINLQSLSRMDVKNPEIGWITREKEIQALGFEPYSSIQHISPDGTSLILYDGVLHLEKENTLPKTQKKELQWGNSFILNNGNIALVDWPQPPFPNKELKGNLTVTTLNSSTYTNISKQNIYFDLADGIQTVALSPDGSILLTGLYDGNLIFWNVKTGKKINEIQAHKKTYQYFGFYDAYVDIIFDNDGSHIATHGYDSKLKVWDMSDYSEIMSTQGRIPVFSQDGNYLAYTLSDNRIQIKSVFDNEPPITFDGHSSRVTKLLFSSDGNLLISTGWDEMVRIWSIKDQSLLQELPQYYAASSLALSPDNSLLYVSTYDGSINIWGYASNY